MNKKYILPHLLICFLPLLLHAQNPGYQGKRFTLNYNLYTLNALNNPNEFGNSGLASFNTLHHFDLDIAVGRKKSIGLSFEYAHTSFSFEKTFTYTRAYSYDYYYENYSFDFRSNSIGKMEIYGIGFYTKMFFGGNIAPLGSYIKPQISLLFYKVYPGNPESELILVPPDPVFVNQSPYKTLALSLELGQNRILFNRLFIDYGVRLGIIPSMLRYLTTEVDESNYLHKVPMQRLASHYLFNIKLGAGVLLF